MFASLWALSAYIWKINFNNIAKQLYSNKDVKKIHFIGV